jgi:hypothetical protein
MQIVRTNPTKYLTNYHPDYQGRLLIHIPG